MQQTRVWKLSKEQELRFEVNSGASVTLRLLDGTAEIFGSELAHERIYTFTKTKLAVFSWHGCDIELGGECHAYIGRETPMRSYAQIHSDLEDLRSSSLRSFTSGPRVMIVGPTDTGKSTLSKILLNYACRLHRTLIYIDIDVGQGALMPGMISAQIIEKPIEHNVSTSNESRSPLIYYYGHTSPQTNPELYKLQISQMKDDVEKHIFYSAKEEKDQLLREKNEIGISTIRDLSYGGGVKEGGIIVNTCGWVEGLGYDLLKYAMKVLKIDVVLVMDQERLYNDLSEEIRRSGGGIKVVIKKLNKSGGVVTRDSGYRRQSRMWKIRDYFYGLNQELTPFSTPVEFDDVVVCKAGGSGTGKEDGLKVVEVAIDSSMLHAVLAVSHGNSVDDLLGANVAGFVYVMEVNMETRKITLLAPCAGALPGKYLMWGSLKWYETA